MSHAEPGFSLVEMLVATALMTMAMSLACAFFVASSHAVSDEMARQETLQGLRATLDTLERDLRLSGACLPTTGNDFPPLSATNNGTLDGVTVRTALVRADMTCIQSTIQAAGSASGTNVGDTTLPLQSVDGFAAGQRSYIRGSNNSGECFTITSVNTSSKTLTIQSGLKAAYLNGSGVWAIDERDYKINQQDYAPLTVVTVAANGANAVPFAYGVQSVNVQYQLLDGTMVDLPTATQWPLVNQLYITVTMQSPNPLSNGKNYTVTGSINVKPRNLLPGTQVLGPTPA